MLPSWGWPGTSRQTSQLRARAAVLAGHPREPRLEVNGPKAGPREAERRREPQAGLLEAERRGLRVQDGREPAVPVVRRPLSS